MHRRLVIVVVAALLLVAGIGSVALGAASASSGSQGGKGQDARPFVGYWMGIDPLDGGDSRRGITRDKGRTLSIIGRDTVFTLCDDTDRALVTGRAARVVGSALVSDDVMLRCFGNGQTLDLTLRYEVLEKGILRETVRTRAGALVDEIIFHRVSQR
jgi:hypothetical protein